MIVNKTCALEIRRICVESAERYLENTIKATALPPGTPGRADDASVTAARIWLADAKEALARTQEAKI